MFVKVFVKSFIAKIICVYFFYCFLYHSCVMNIKLFCISLTMLTGCATKWAVPSDMTFVPIKTQDFEIATYQRLTDSESAVHIYIEGDGNAFDSWGRPTNNPTPQNTLVRNWAAGDPAPNVAYVARPCQYIMGPTCNKHDWTDGRFSESVINSMATAVKTIANGRPAVLIGYSGGSMVSGLIIKHNPDMNIQKWITVAGVLNHSDWTQYFGDKPLNRSLDMDALPQVPQVHIIAQNDRVVPNKLSYKWTENVPIIIQTNATHSKFPNLKIPF